MSRISCGSIGPSVNCWPFFTKSPLKTMTCLPIGMRCSSSEPVCGSLMINAALAANVRAKVHDAVDLGDLGGVLRTARFEQFGHARQTAGDVLGLGGFARRLGHQRAGDESCRLRSTTMCAPEGIGVVGENFLLVVDDDDLRMQIFLVLDDDHGLLRRSFRPFPASSSRLR